MMQTSKNTVLDAYNEYLKETPSKNVDKMLVTIFIKFLIPAWGGKAPSSIRATKKDIDYALSFLQNKPVSLLNDVDKLLENSLSSQEVTLSNRRVYRSILKSFLNWLKEKNNLIKPTQPDAKVEEKLTRGRNGKGLYSSPNKVYHGVKHKKPYALLSHKEDYLNENLSRELEEFTEFREKNNCTKATIGLDIRNIKSILGWLHRFKNITLEELSLSKVIYVCNLVNFDFSENNDSWDKHITEVYKLKHRANAVARDNLKLIEDYFKFFSGHPKTETIFISTLISVSNYLYQKYINTEEYPTNKDIPIIQQLHKLKSSILQKVKASVPAVPYSAKSIPWLKLLEVLEKLRIEADTTQYIVTSKERTKGYRTLKRRTSGLVNDLQNFLMVAFVTLIPPLRPRAYYELEIGETLVKGLLKEGRFTPSNKLSNEEETFWYIHLSPRQYKTGKLYKEYWKDIPNIRFPDGKCFYEYIDKWINEYREFDKLCEHNYFFRRTLLYTPFNHITWRDKICNIFDRLTGVPVAPKEFRKMFVTYLHDSNATEAEKEAAAASMQHSRRMQASVYDQQSILDKIQPVNQFIEKAFNYYWQQENIPLAQNISFPQEEQILSEQFTRFKISRKNAAQEIRRLRNMSMSNEQIIQFLWDATPERKEEYQEAIAELDALGKT